MNTILRCDDDYLKVVVAGAAILIMISQTWSIEYIISHDGVHWQ